MMLATIQLFGQKFTIDLDDFIDLSQGFHPNQGPRAWWVDYMKATPVRMGEWVGSVKEGGSVNFYDLLLNPHGQGTHTECVGHIRAEQDDVNQMIKSYWFPALLVSRKSQSDFISLADVPLPSKDWPYEALLVRSLPNSEEKKSREYSGSNPPAFFPNDMEHIADAGVKHFLTDLPSVDPEKDEGRLASHHAFFLKNGQVRPAHSITELIFVPDNVPDGRYLLNLQLAPIHNDAVPSRPLLFTLVP